MNAPPKNIDFGGAFNLEVVLILVSKVVHPDEAICAAVNALRMLRALPMGRQHALCKFRRFKSS